MKYLLTIAFGSLLILALAVSAADNSDRIYGKIITVDGDEFEGLIRWDKNEANWIDILDGTKKIPKKNRKEANKSKRRKYRDKKSEIRLFGIGIGSTNVSYSSNTAQSGIRFGHIRTLEVLDDDRCLIITKSGLEFELDEGSTDIGSDIREIVIEDNEEGEIELVWDDVELIEFGEGGANLESNFGERLYGTLTTRRGDIFTGYVCWDFDEVFTLDILDGEERNRKRKIKFGKIKVIERYSSNGAKVIFTDGNDAVLRESNDVDSGNRGILILDKGMGQVVVDWSEFDRLEFSPINKPVRYDDFDGGTMLSGTITTEDGDTYTGNIRWDNDEEYTWELLNGEYRDVSFDVEIGQVKSIEKRGCCSSIVTLRDGRELRLSGSNDVDDDNKGIFVTIDNDETVEVDWEDFEKAVFK